MDGRGRRISLNARSHFPFPIDPQGLYERSGYMASEELSISILAGSCVGGGTTLNWCASFRTPKHVRKDWVETRGLKQFACGYFAVNERALCVSPDRWVDSVVLPK